MAFDILEAVLSSRWRYARLDREAWRDLNYSTEQRETGGEARKRLSIRRIKNGNHDRGLGWGWGAAPGLRRDLGEDTN